MNTPIEKAVQVAGSQSALARTLGVTPQAVQQWVDANRIPAHRCLAIENATGISRYDLRPDVFGAQPKAA